VALALPAALVVATPAGAATTVRLSGGTTTLTLNGRTARALRAAGIKVSAAKPAKVKGTKATFKISGGSIDPATAKGTIDHKGGLTLKAGRVKVTIANLSFNTSKGTVTAKIGKSKVSVASAKGGKVSRDGVATTLAGVNVKLSKKGAAALNKAFGVRGFTTGLALGKATLATTPPEVAVEGGATRLVLDARTAAGLGQLRVAVGPIAPATADAATGAISFPATGGTLAVRGNAGSVEHSGGISLTQQGRSPIELTNPVLTVSATPQLAVTFGGAGIPIADIDAAALRSTLNEEERTLEITGATLRLTGVAAGALDSFFLPTGAPSAFPAGAVLGTTTTTLELR
jgi:hypothetical protein